MASRALPIENQADVLRLTEEIEALVSQLVNAVGHSPPDGVEAGSLSPAGVELSGLGSQASKNDRLLMPDLRLIHGLIRARQRRLVHLKDAQLADPAWDMLLDLTAASVEGRRVSVTSLCIASGVPATTALRWINQLVEVGLFERTSDESDGRRTFVRLTAKGANGMARYLRDYIDIML